ncbi:MAG: hypothetical protein ACR2KP_07915 [Egibacteraceae bacterium]
MTNRSDDAPPDPLDRIKAPQRRVQERSRGDRLEAPDADQQGRAALFTPTQRRGAPITVHCSRCKATSPVDAGTALRSTLPLFLVAPWRDHPVFAVCPACRRRSWLRPGVETLS